MELDYEDSKYLLSYKISQPDENRSDYLSDSNIVLWFGLKQYIVLSPITDNIRDNSLRRLLFSALCTGLELSKCYISAFLASSQISKIDDSVEVLGYKIVMQAPHTQQSLLLPIFHSSGVIFYESVVQESVGRKHQLYYLDGLLRLFGSKLWNFSYGNIAISDELVVISVWEMYDYLPTKNSSASIYVLTSNVTSLTNRTHPAIQSTLDDLSAGFAALYSETSMSLGVDRITLQLCYKDMKQGSVVDNDYYTTLLPSKLPPKAFVAHAEFASPSSIRTIQSPDPNSACVYSSALRRLLALYICCKTAKKGMPLRSFTTIDGGNASEIINIEKANSIAYVLSKECRRSVELLCATATAEYIHNPPNNSGNHQNDLLMRIFSRSLWIDSPADGPWSTLNVNGSEKSQHTSDPSPFTLAEETHLKLKSHDKIAWDWLGRANAAPVGSLLSLSAIFMSSLNDITMMATLWQDFVRELRIHWENRIPIPRLYPSVPITVENGPTTSTRTNSSSNRSRSLSSNPPYENINKEIPKAIVPLNYGVDQWIDTSNEVYEPMWVSPLWDDVINKGIKKGIPFSLPNPTQNLAFQKLQVLTSINTL